MTPRSRKVCVGCRAGHFEKTVAFPFGRRRRQYSMEDMPMTSRLRFGVFLAPFHKPGINPTLALQNDLDLVAWLDRLGYDEAWFGEHHSAGTEISASPEIMIAVAAERTRHIKLGTGVVSLSYHNPLWVAERIVLLDHLTRGRAMFGAGPGSLPTDGIMIGVPQSETRELLEQSLNVIMRLLAGDEPVTFKNHRWDLLGEEARVHGKTVDRSNWRLVGPMHCAETKEQAVADVQYGIEHWFRYFQAVAAFPQMAVLGDSAAEMIDFINQSGLGVIGTPEECAAQIDRLVKQSNGGFGCYLLLGHNWANPQATAKSFELIARHVMPHFQGQAQSTLDSAERARAARPELAGLHAKAVEAAGERYAKERGARTH